MPIIQQNQNERTLVRVCEKWDFPKKKQTRCSNSPVKKDKKIAHTSIYMCSFPGKLWMFFPEEFGVPAFPEKNRVPAVSTESLEHKTKQKL